MGIWNRRKNLAIGGNRSWGMITLCLWLILAGIGPLFHIRFMGMETLHALLALGAGVLLFLGK